MAEYRTEIVVARPPAEVFAFLTQPANAPRWMPAVLELEVLGDGVVRRGAVLRETRRIRDRPCSAEVAITEHAGPAQGGPPFRHATCTKAAGVRCTYAYELAPAPGGTRVELLASAEPQSFFGRLVAKAMLAMMIKSDGDQLERLAAALADEPSPRGAARQVNSERPGAGPPRDERPASR